MPLVKINTPVHYHVKKYIICKNKICQGPVSCFDGNMVVSAGMAHIKTTLFDIRYSKLTQSSRGELDRKCWDTFLHISLVETLFFKHLFNRTPNKSPYMSHDHAHHVKIEQFA